MDELGVNRAQQRQLALVLRMLVESTEPWPEEGLLIRFEGPTLQVDDKVLLVRLLERADDAGVARLARPLDTSVWNGIQRCVQRLADSATLLRGFADDEMPVCLVEAVQEEGDGLEVTLNSELVSAWRDLRPGEDEELLDALAFELRARVSQAKHSLLDGLAHADSVLAELREKRLASMLRAFRPERHGGEFPGPEQRQADDAITGLQQALAGQFVSDEALDRALESRLGQEDQASAARESAESSDMRAAAMRCRAGVLEVPMGKIKSFGPFGPQYKVGEPVRQLDDGDWLIAVTLVAGGEKEEYRLSKALEDPDAL